MAEFTGERVVPGLVDDDLFNEHVARYRFAARCCKAGAVLDAGCGTGYGAVLFEGVQSVTAIDVAPEAIQHARDHFARPHIRYAQASCEALPFVDAAFDLVCAFEVIEHLTRWNGLLTEARRVLKPGGLLLVSTPNKAYYAEVRAKAGPNPFHTHEFEYAEFDAALKAVFPHVRIWSQNHADSIVFAPIDPSAARVDATGDPHPENAHFFIAACGMEEIAPNDLYAWIPASANVLRERERHIAKLEGELADKNMWLERRAREHSQLHAKHERTLEELRARNEWALGLDKEIEQVRASVRDLQNEADERLKWVRGLEESAADLERRIGAGELEIARLNTHREQLESDLAARAAWGFALDAEVQSLTVATRDLEEQRLSLAVQIGELRQERVRIAGSKWIRLGRKLNLGPRVE